MAHHCLRSLGSKLPTSPMSQTIGGSGLIFKPTISNSPLECTPFKAVSRLPMLPVDDQIAALNSTWRSPHLPSFSVLYPYGVKPMELHAKLNRCYSESEIDLVKSYNMSFNDPKRSILSCTATEISGTSGDKLPPKSDDTGSGKPNQDELQRIHDTIVNSLLQLFTTTMNYSVYSKDIVLVDNIRNKTTHGIMSYVQQVALLRAVGHFKFAFVKLEILNTHISTEEARITIRWRINGISGMRVMLRFWKFRLWNWREIMTSQETWYDGISHFDVGDDGFVFRHTVDKMMEDKDSQAVEVKQDKAALAAKLGVLASLFPQPTGLALSKTIYYSFQLYDTDNPGFQAQAI